MSGASVPSAFISRVLMIVGALPAAADPRMIWPFGAERAILGGGMRVVFFGAGGFAVPALRWVINSAHELVCVVTQPDRPAGRGKQLTPTPVAERAAMEGFEAVRCGDVNTPAFVEQMRGLAADLGVVVDFGRSSGWICVPLFPATASTSTAPCCPGIAGRRRWSTRFWPAIAGPA